MRPIEESPKPDVQVCLQLAGGSHSRTPLARILFLLPLLVSITTFGDSSSQAPADPFSACREIFDVGLFNEETMACFPWLRQAVAEKLCETPVRKYGDFPTLGFGAGFNGYGTGYRSTAEFMEMSEIEQRDHFADFWAAYRAWRAGNCEGVPAAVVTRDEFLEPWEEVLEKLPQSLVVPWRSCWNFSLAISAPEWFESGGARCIIGASYDQSGEETITFTVRVDPKALFHLTTRLKQEIETQGVDCGKKAWRKGKRLKNFRLNVLKCRRLGRSAVSMKAVTAGGTCEAELPERSELAHVDWRDLCGGRK